jgi:hypothetical protein
MNYLEHFWKKQFPNILIENSLPKVYSFKVQKLLQNPAFIARLKRPVNIISNKDVPYLAGYSKDGKDVFFDRNFKPFLRYHGKTYDTRDFILLHEVGEKALIDLFGLKYQSAHHIITHLEFETVEGHGLPWKVYDKFLKPQIKHIYHEKLQDIPKNLDTTPYRDEHERKILTYLKQGQDIRPHLKKKQFLKVPRRH